MDKKGLILFIDEENLIISYYMKAINSKGYKTVQINSPDNVLESIESYKETLAAIVLDIMMPPGNIYKNIDTKDGLETGILVYQDIRKHLLDTLVVVLSNVKNNETLTFFNERNILVMQKLDCPPFVLAETLDKLLLRKG